MSSSLYVEAGRNTLEKSLLCRLLELSAVDSVLWTELAPDFAAGLGACQGEASDQTGGWQERESVGSLLLAFMSAFPFIC